MKQISEKRWCKTHVPHVVGKDQWGNFYEQCYVGHRKNESCEVIIEEYKKEVNKNE